MVAFDLNGRRVEVLVPEELPVLWILRDKLHLTGTKFGCGRGLCGACTIHVDGGAVRACILPAKAIAGKRVTTIEGLASESELHPLQKAWIEMQVPQCGYCQSGQLMSAAALLGRSPHPTADEISAAMNGNLCRCGTYGRIRKAIARAAEGG
jgi:aerobic-type carbon monoxide dehydrogenase small subunit (CoxS/CutS family)